MYTYLLEVTVASCLCGCATSSHFTPSASRLRGGLPVCVSSGESVCCERESCLLNYSPFWPLSLRTERVVCHLSVRSFGNLFVWNLHNVPRRPISDIRLPEPTRYLLNLKPRSDTGPNCETIAHVHVCDRQECDRQKGLMHRSDTDRHSLARLSAFSPGWFSRQGFKQGDPQPARSRSRASSRACFACRRAISRASLALSSSTAVR